MAGSSMLTWSWCLSLSACFSLSVANELARGWGSEIAWVTLEEGLNTAKSESKPLMLIIHKSWCGACKALGPKFAESTEILELSKKFVMVNTQDDEEPSDKQFTPDGGYIPRIYFLDLDGNVDTSIINEGGSDKYKYYYPDPKQIAKSMHKVLGSNQDVTNNQRGEEL